MLQKMLFSSVLFLVLSPLLAHGEEKMPESLKQAVLQAVDLSKGNQIFNRADEDDKKETKSSDSSKKSNPPKINGKKSAPRKKEQKNFYIPVVVHAVKGLDNSIKVEFKMYDFWDELFPRLDKNHDGKLSLEEYIGNDTKPNQIKDRETHFKEKDVHNQGFLTLDDIKAFAKSKKAKDAPPDEFIAIFSATGVKTEPDQSTPTTQESLPEVETRLCAAVKKVLAKYLNENNIEVSIHLIIKESLVDGKREISILVLSIPIHVDSGEIYTVNEKNEIVNTLHH